MINELSLYYLVIFLLGLCVGSFLNVVIFRLENGWKIVNDRSKCLHCEHVLAAKDLIPVLSFVLLRGKCGNCGKKINVQYPVVEIITGVMFVLIFDHIMNLNFPLSIFNFPISEFQITFHILASIFYYLLIASLLIVIFVYDYKHYIIPDEAIWIAVIAAFLYNAIADETLRFILVSGFGNFSQFADDENFLIGLLNMTDFIINNSIFLNRLFAACVSFSFFFAIVFATKGKGMGGGDVKLGFLMGLILGWPNISVAILISFIVGSIFGISLVILGRKGMKSMIPFGPFLVAGTFITMFWGGAIMKWYFGYVN